MKTTLFALISACGSAIIDGYEVDEFRSDGTHWTVLWNGKQSQATFADLTYEVGQDNRSFEVVDLEANLYEIQFFAHGRHLTPVETVLDVDATFETRSARIDLLTEIYEPLACIDTDTDKKTLAASLLADIRLWCDAHGVDFFEASDCAYEHYLDESHQPGPESQTPSVCESRLGLPPDTAASARFARSNARKLSFIVGVSDAKALHQHALHIATGAQHQLSEMQALETLGTADEPDVASCLFMAFEPSVPPPGTTIMESGCS
jgi:hypothetical protein